MKSILGDFSMEKGEKTNEILRRLHGRLYLIEGNHDYYLKDSDFERERFVWIKPYAEMKDYKRSVILCHYPVFCYHGQYRKDQEGNDRTYMLYGHVHNSFDDTRFPIYQGNEGGKEGKYVYENRRADPVQHVELLLYVFGL